MTLTEANFKTRILAFRDHADTPREVKEFLTATVDQESDYFGEVLPESGRVDTYLNKTPASIALGPMTKIVKFVRRNRGTIPDA